MPEPNDHPAFERKYTVLLLVVSGLALLMVFSHSMLIGLVSEDPDESDRLIIVVYRCLRAFEVCMCVFALIAALARIYETKMAQPATTAVSILLAMWPPIGTATFIYWLGWVRRREGGQPPTPVRDP